MTLRRVAAAIAGIVCAVSLGPGCAATPGSTTPETATPDAATSDNATSDTATSDTATSDTAAPGTAASDAATPDTSAPGAFISETTVVAETTAPVEAVPGLDSDDAFCRAWSRFTGTFQALSVPSAFGAIDDDELTRRELVSAPLTVIAGGELLAALPESAATEREVLAAGLVDPTVSRAADGVAALRAAGADDADLAALSEVWIAALEGFDPISLELPVVLDDRLVGLVDAAVVEFLAVRPSWWEDTSLDSEVTIPLTLDHATETCPDAGLLAGVAADD